MLRVRFFDKVSDYLTASRISKLLICIGFIEWYYRGTVGKLDISSGLAHTSLSRCTYNVNVFKDLQMLARCLHCLRCRGQFRGPLSKPAAPPIASWLAECVRVTLDAGRDATGREAHGR